MSTTPPGWYKNGDVMRYWDGVNWTEQTQPIVHGAAPVAESGGMGLAITGYVFAIIIPIVGFILGIVAVTRGEGNASKKHGVWIIILSALAALIWVLIISNSHSQTCSTYYGTC